MQNEPDQLKKVIVPLILIVIVIVMVAASSVNLSRVLPTPRPDETSVEPRPADDPPQGGTTVGTEGAVRDARQLGRAPAAGEGRGSEEERHQGLTRPGNSPARRDSTRAVESSSSGLGR